MGVASLISEAPVDIGLRDEQLQTGIGSVKRDAVYFRTVPTGSRDG